jgi:hypothetical protein
MEKNEQTNRQNTNWQIKNRHTHTNKNRMTDGVIKMQKQAGRQKNKDAKTVFWSNQKCFRSHNLGSIQLSKMNE